LLLRHENIGDGRQPGSSSQVFLFSQSIGFLAVESHQALLLPLPSPVQSFQSAKGVLLLGPVCVSWEQANFNMHAGIHTTMAMLVYSKKMF
jgi:hypothetical protein